MIGPTTLNGKWPTVPLGKAVQFLDHLRKPVTSSDRSPGPYPYYGANGQQDSVDDYIFDEPLVLLAEDGGNFGDPGKTIAYQIEGKTWVNNHAHVLRPNPNVDIRFLCRHLEYYDVRQFVSGTTRLKLNKGKAAQIPIALPKLEEQKRIAAILDKADAILRNRKEARDIANHLIDVAFKHLFGDCVVNEKEFDTCDFQDLCGKIVDCPHSTPTYADAVTEYACVRSSDLQDGYIDWESTKYVTKSEYETRIARHTPVAGEVLYTREGGRLGNAAQVPPGSQVCLGQRIMLFSAKQGATTNEFLWALLNSPGVRHQVNTLTAGAAAPRINISDIRKLQGFRPPFKLQEQFTKAVEKIEHLRQTQIAAETDEKQLFNSLVQRAFKGEL